MVKWVTRLLSSGSKLLVPEIADYEVRRELERARMETSLQRLDQLGELLGYLPISTSAMRKAAEYWARARRRGYPTADDKAIDADVILAAQAATLDPALGRPIVATMNVGHLARFVEARRWQEIG